MNKIIFFFLFFLSIFCSTLTKSHQYTTAATINKQTPWSVDSRRFIYCAMSFFTPSNTYTLYPLYHFVSHRQRFVRKNNLFNVRDGFLFHTHPLIDQKKSIHRHFFLFSTREKFHTIIMNLVQLVCSFVYFTILPHPLLISLAITHSLSLSVSQ